MKTALITGVTGQDGAYLAELLLNKGYTVHGTYRRRGVPELWRLRELGVECHPAFHLVHRDLDEPDSFVRLLEDTGANEIYNLAAHSFVGASFDHPVQTLEVTGRGAVCMLEAVRKVNPSARFYQASTSEMFGNAVYSPQREDTPFHPRSPYGAAKLYAHWMAVNYREIHGIFAASGILFNHESPLRGREFLTRKVTDGIARLRLGKLDVLELGNLDARRDWGYAREYVEAMWRMLQADAPDTYVLATNRAESVRTFVALAAQSAGFEIEWKGSGMDEVGVDRMSGRILVRVNRALFRPTEEVVLTGNPEKARVRLGWTPKTDLEGLCGLMVAADLSRHQAGVASTRQVGS